MAEQLPLIYYSLNGKRLQWSTTRRNDDL